MSKCSLIARMNLRSHSVLVTILFILFLPFRENQISSRHNMNETLDVDETLADGCKINMLQPRLQLYLGILNNEWNNTGTIITQSCQLQEAGSKRNGKNVSFLQSFCTFAYSTFSRERRRRPQTTPISFEALATLISRTNPALM